MVRDGITVRPIFQFISARFFRAIFILCFILVDLYLLEKMESSGIFKTFGIFRSENRILIAIGSIWEPFKMDAI